MNQESRAPAQGAFRNTNSASSRLHNVIPIRNVVAESPHTTRSPGERRKPWRLDQVDTYPQLLHDFDLVYEAYVSLLVEYAHLFNNLSEGRQEHLLYCQLPFHFKADALNDLHTVINAAKAGTV